MASADHRKRFYAELRTYLRDFHCGLQSPAEDDAKERGSWWARPSEGALPLSLAEFTQYDALLQDALVAFAAADDLSEAAIDSALHDAIFTVVDLPGHRDSDVETRLQEAVRAFATFVETPPQGYECWIEVDGVEASSLPAAFGMTQFAVLGDEQIDRLERSIKDKHTVGRKQKLEILTSAREELAGRHVAIQHVRARDARAAIVLAGRAAQVTIECLNAFANLVPYNHAYLRLTPGKPGTGSSLRMALADDGSFLDSAKAQSFGTFSFDRFGELAGPVSDAGGRVDALLRKAERGPVDELLLRAVRWVGRAAAATTPEDAFLYSMIALDCVVRPTP